MIILLLVIGAVFIIYGALVASGKHTPISSKMMVEEDNLKRWCHSAGISKMVWGVAIIFLTFYLQDLFPKALWGICFLIIAVWNIQYTVKNNEKFMK